MNHAIKLFILCIALFATNTFASTNNSKPDFAFPQKVSQQAETNLDVALKNGDGKLVIKSLIEYTVAQGLINRDSTQSIITKVEQVITKEKDPCSKALLNALLCQIYCNYYETTKRHSVDQRAVIDSESPSDITEWSKKDFENKVLMLCDEALKDADALKKAKLSDYSDIITHNNLTFRYYPTLYDFIIQCEIKYINSIFSDVTASNGILPLNEFLSTPISETNPAAHRIYSLYQNILSFHISDTAPLIYWDLMRIDDTYDSQPTIFDDDSNSIITQRNKAVQDLYDTYSESEYASLALIYQWEYGGEYMYSKRAHFYNLLKNRLKRFPAFSGNCEIENIINTIENQNIGINYCPQIAPNDTLHIILRNTNSKSITIDILRLPDNIKSGRTYSFPKGAKPVVYKTIERVYDQEIPFNITDTINATISQPGYYSIIAYNNKSTKNLNSLEILYCSELTSFSSDRINNPHIWVVNAKSGNVVSNADINIYEDSHYIAKNKPILTTKSSKNGIINLKQQNAPQYYYTISKGDDKYAPNSFFFLSKTYSDTTWVDRGSCFTSLPLYHQGDTAAWSAVIYSTKGDTRKLAAHRTFSVIFRDANYMQIDTAIVTTDEFGRIEGKFAIPTDRLTGNYSINIIGRFNRQVAKSSFMVSDYKLPTFEVKNLDVDKRENGEYIISGEVRSFSGFALSDATIHLNLLSREYQFYSHQSFTTVLNDTTTTDFNGKFSFSIPKKLIDGQPWDKAIFKAEIIATSPNGESQSANKTFTNGKSYYIFYYSLEGFPIEVSKNTKLNIKLCSLSGNSVDGSIHYSIINNDNDIVKSGSFPSANPVVDWSDIASGKYKIKLHSIAPTATDTNTVKINLYRLTDALPPINNGLWLHRDKYTITKDNSVEFYYGSTFSDGDILYVLYDDNKVYDQRWIKAKAGIHKSRILLPKGVNEASMKLIAVNNYKSYYVSAQIDRASANKGFKISAESFRDKITPGSEEQWVFSITDANGNGSKSAVLMDMYSLAIEKLESHNFYLHFYTPPHYSNISSPAFYNNSYSSYYRNPILKYCTSVMEPKFNTYGYPLLAGRYTGNIYVRALSSSGRSKNSSIEQYAIAEEEIAEDNSEVLGEVVASKRVCYAVQSVSDSPEDSNSPNITLRDNETPLAFFRPMLTTDTLGNLTYSFTVPNANTTWLFNAIAYNKDLDVAHFAREVLANKPIMVQPNMPRFLRNGDKATIKASVMNNSDSALIITTIIELFDPSTAKNISTHRQIDTIQASQSTLASIEIKAPIDATMIGYRIKSYCDNFGDGEQSLIPILPASSPVIETTTFYMGIDEKSYTQTLPTMPADARVTLEFCENPTWYAVTALPGLNKNQSRTSTSAAMAIYSAAIADGIVRQNPQIANAIYQWQHSDKSDSTLVSMLSRNQDLKNMLLSATPWVQNAENDTERMARLSLLFDKKSNKTAIDKNIHQLATLQRSGGGWAWIAECDKASTWATLSILEKIGHMKKLGFLPDNKDLNSMTENALKYIDAEYAQLYKKYPKGDYSLYVFIRDMFPEYKQSTAAKKVTNATIQQIVGNWKQYSLVKKATSAIILNNNGYNSTAREILNSVTEFAQTSQSKGMWWPTIENDSWDFDKILSHANILDAYHQITPNNKDIDKMRQWLIINKEANDWGNSSATSYVIYTLLNTGTHWTRPSLGCEILLNDESITPTRFDNITGYVKTDISPLAPSGKKLTIAKHGEYPSWGAVYRQFNADMTDIKAVAGNDISIEKTLLKKVGDKWIIATDYKVGDLIKIQLTIKAKRDIDYVTITDERAACFEPTEQLPKPIFAEGIFFYRENRDEATNIFVTNLPKGTYLLTYDMYVNNEGEFASGIATIQSQYAPQITAHTSGNHIIVSK